MGGTMKRIAQEEIERIRKQAEAEWKAVFGHLEQEKYNQEVLQQLPQTRSKGQKLCGNAVASSSDKRLKTRQGMPKREGSKPICLSSLKHAGRSILAGIRLQAPVKH
jgi:hypothetical protein